MDADLTHPLVLKVAHFGSENISTKTMILDQICGGRIKQIGGRSLYSALKLDSLVGPVQVDFSLVDTDLFLDIDGDRVSFPAERGVFEIAKQADFFLFDLDWRKPNSQEVAIECIKKCMTIFDDETPKAIIGTKAEGFLRKKKEKPVLPALKKLVEDHDLPVFDYLSSSHDKGVGNFIPLVITKVLNYDNMRMETDGGLSHASADIHQMVLVPKIDDEDSTKLEFITLPPNDQLSLGRAELLKKSSFDRRISKQGHLLIHCSDKGRVAVRALKQARLVITAPDSYPRTISEQDELVGLEEDDQLSIVPSLDAGNNEDMTYVLKSGTDAMKAASFKEKQKPAFILFSKLQDEKARTFNLQKIIRSQLTKAKEARFDAKAAQKMLTARRRTFLLAADGHSISTAEEEEENGGSGTDDSYDAAQTEFFAETQDPIAEILENLGSFNV
jgi:hypothetical protein